MAKIQVSLHRDMQEDYNYKESIKTLRTNLQFAGNKLKVIMFTSSLPEEGKSDICFAMAKSLAQIGKKTILLDADIRKSVLMNRYQIGRKVSGLSQYLSGQTDLDNILCGTDIENLDMIFAGQYSPNSADLLEDELFKNLVAKLKTEYDYVIVDTPPIASVTDGVIVAGVCDGIILVVESGTMSHRLVEQVKNQLKTTGTRIIGAVLNKVDIRSEAYYSKYGKYRKYGKYGKYDKYGKYGKYGKYAYASYNYGKYGSYGGGAAYGAYGISGDYGAYGIDRYDPYGPAEGTEQKKN